MTTTTDNVWQLVKPEKLARQFTRLGWVGFWVQLALLLIPLGLLLYIIVVRSPESSQQFGIDLSNYLSYGSLLIMVFTTIWFLRYPRIANQIIDTAKRPRRASVERTLWVGVWASSLGIVFSMILLFGAAWRLLFTLLANPQTGVIIAPGPGGDPVQSISAIDAVSLTALLIILAAELLVLSFSIWLLFRTMRAKVD